MKTGTKTSEVRPEEPREKTPLQLTAEDYETMRWFAGDVTAFKAEAYQWRAKDLFAKALHDLGVLKGGE